MDFISSLEPEVRGEPVWLLDVCHQQLPSRTSPKLQAGFKPNIAGMVLFDNGSSPVHK